MARPPLDAFVNNKPPLDSFLAPQATQPSTPNYFQRVGQQFGQIGSELVGDIIQSSEALTPENLRFVGGSPGAVAAGIARAAMRPGGAAARGAFVPIMEAPGIKQLTEKAAEKVTEIPGAQELIKSLTDVAVKYPNVSKDIRDIVDIASLGVGGAVEKPLVQEARAIGQDIALGTKTLLTPSEKAVQNKIIQLFQKSIKPRGQATTALAEKYDDSVVSALKTIKANADNLNIEDISGELIAGRTPQTINELAQGLDQTKKLVFTQYDDLARQATGAGATIDAVNIADEVATVAQNKALQLTNPSVVAYAKGWEARLREMGVIDAQTAQEAVQMMNANLQAFYRNPTYDTASKVAVDAGIANNLRQALDKAIEGATGQEYTALKKQYGALKAIENDVVRASMREGRKNARGLLDYSDIFTGGQMVGGILSLNPAMFTKGAIERGFKEYIKYLNDPNRAIKNIFDKIGTGADTSFTPQSATFKSAAEAIKNPRLGLGLEDVSKNQEFQRLQSIQSNTKNINKNGIGATSTTIPKELQPLAAEAKKYKSAEEFVKAQGDSFYHTTPNEFEKFDKSFLGSNTDFDNARNGFFFTDNLEQIDDFKNVLKEGFGGGFVTEGRKKTAAELAKYRTIEKITKKENFFNFNYNAKDLTAREARDFAEFADKKMGGLYDLDGNVVNHKKMTDSQLGKFLKENVFVDDLDPDFSFLPRFTEEYLEDFTKYLEVKGYKGMISDYARGKNEYLIFDPNVLPTRAQLTDLWNKVNKQP